MEKYPFGHIARHEVQVDGKTACIGQYARNILSMYYFLILSVHSRISYRIIVCFQPDTSVAYQLVQIILFIGGEIIFRIACRLSCGLQRSGYFAIRRQLSFDEVIRQGQGNQIVPSQQFKECCPFSGFFGDVDMQSDRSSIVFAASSVVHLAQIVEGVRTAASA